MMVPQIKHQGRPVVGFGDGELSSPAIAATSPWPMMLVTTVVSATTGWVLEEIAYKSRRRKRRR